MRWSDIPFNASERMLRQFAGLAALALVLVALWKGSTATRAGLGWPAWTWALVAVAAAVGVIGWTKPVWLRPVFVGWMVLAFPIGWLMSLVLLLVLFFGLFTPVALLFRLLGRDSLMLRRQARESYWLAKSSPSDLRRYFRQY
ncbi:MAG: SxtJ family membrane protein [Pirellulales bacterium]